MNSYCQYCKAADLTILISFCIYLYNFRENYQCIPLEGIISLQPKINIMKNIAKYLTVIIISLIMVSCNTSPKLGIFEGNTDIGNVGYAGSLAFDPADETYVISGSGTNMWFDTDELHYVWKQMSGDVAISADIEWVGQGVEAHRKACLIIRQSLDPGSAYADAVVHGDGLTSIQYREDPGGTTREVQSNISAPMRVRLEKEGEYV